MTFEYRNPANGDRLAAVPLDDNVWLKTSPKGCLIPPDRVEEVIAGIRDTARTAARQTTGQDDTWPLATSCGYCAHTLNWHVTGGRCRVTAGENGCGCTAFVAPDGSHPDTASQPDPAVVEQFIQHMAAQPDPTTADDPTPLRWGLGDVLHGDDDSVIVCLSGPGGEPYWLELDAERATAFRDDLTPPGDEQLAEVRRDIHEALIVLPAPEADRVRALVTRLEAASRAAVGQPAEAHDTDQARPPRAQWRVEGYDADEWNPLGLPENNRDTAVAKRTTWARRLPGVPTRVVRETTTWTVEDETR